MRWFRHESTANRNAKLEKVLMKYGTSGYGLYWLCLELIADRIDSRTADFELRHDSEILACRSKLGQAEVEEMMIYMVKLELFENIGTHITCMKMADMIENQIVKNPQIKALQDKIRDDPGISGKITEISGQIRLDEIRLNKIREEEIHAAAPASPVPKKPKKEKEPGPEKRAIGTFENVFMTEAEIKKIGDHFPIDHTARIDALSEWKKSKGKVTKDDYATVLCWARREGWKPAGRAF